MGTQWVIVEGEPWRVVRVRGTVVEMFVVERGKDGKVCPSYVGDGQVCPSYGEPGGLCLPLAGVVECLLSQGYRGEGVLLGLGSWRAGVAELGPQLEEVRRDGAALSLVLEGELPWAAEEFVAEFVRGRRDAGEPGGLRLPLAVTSGEGYLGIALRTEEVSGWIAEWEAAGVWVQGIVPWALVRVQALIKDRLVGPDDWVVIGEEDGAVSLVELREGQVAGWEWLPVGDGEEIGRRLVMSAMQAGDVAEGGTGQGARSTVAIGLGEVMVDELRRVAGDRMRVVNAPLNSDALFAAKLLAGRERPWVNWRIGSLADPRPYRAIRGLAIVAVVLSLIAMGMLLTGLRMLAGRYEERARSLSEQQGTLFQNTLPGQQVTVGVRRRFESELVRLKAERGDANTGTHVVSTPEMLERGLAALPEALRVRVKSIEVDGPQLTLDCEVRSLTESALLVESLSQAGFEVASPRTELVNGIVPLRLSAVWKGER